MESLQTGRAVRELKAQLGRLPDWLSYYAAVLRTSEGAVMPTEGEILNVVKRVPLGVVAQARLPLVQSQCRRPQLISLFHVDRAVQSPSADRRQEDRTSSRTSAPRIRPAHALILALRCVAWSAGCRKQCPRQAL